MDKSEIKKLLKEQVEPMDLAVGKKLAYLQSDEVFTDTIEHVSLGDDSLMNAFSSESKPTSIPTYSQPKAQEFYTEVKSAITPKYAEQEPSSSSIEERKQNIAAKIAALRGISMPGDYLHKK